jgi:hypothetical protein
MGTKIPREIRLEVLRKWLEGKSRDLIAYQVQIGTGTVSGIIKEFKKGDFNAYLLRETALQLKSRGLEIQSFAPLVRLRRALAEKMELISDLGSGQGGGKEEWEGKEQEQQGNSNYNNWNNDDLESIEKKMESLIMSLEVFCYKKNLSVRQFLDCICSIYLTAEKIGIPVEDTLAYIKQQQTHVKDLKRWTMHWQSEEKDAMERCGATRELLEEFLLWRPTFDSNQQLKRKLEQVTKERDKYKFELQSEIFFRNERREQRSWPVSQNELGNTYKDLSIEYARLLEK